ncbi:unnamed protein product [Meloidogyne enterolobii]|uniref:Uncharacterized protein n=2 Tax=Meloidogyne enterolobii TaxID=390850 RepID=A0A6V7WY50_MELEN|nr:unnamed protein product [Meloidogyne enterolobii]
MFNDKLDKTLKKGNDKDKFDLFFENFEKEKIADRAVLYGHKVVNGIRKKLHSKNSKNVGGKHGEEHKKEN